MYDKIHYKLKKKKKTVTEKTLCPQYSYNFGSMSTIPATYYHLAVETNFKRSVLELFRNVQFS